MEQMMDVMSVVDLLPYELWFEIAVHLRDLCEIANFGAVCKGWNQVVHDPELWRTLLRTVFPRAPLKQLLDLQLRSHKSGAAAQVADPHERLCRDLYLSSRGHHPVRGGCNQRLGYTSGKGASKLALDPSWAQTHFVEGLERTGRHSRCPRKIFDVSTAVVFESLLFIIETPGWDCDSASRTVLRILEINSGQHLTFIIEIPRGQSEWSPDLRSSVSLGISEQNRLLLIATRGSLNAYSLDALLYNTHLYPRAHLATRMDHAKPEATTVASSSAPSIKEFPVLCPDSPSMVWSVLYDGTESMCLTEMAVVDLHNRVYIVMDIRSSYQPRNRPCILGITLCSSRSDGEGIDKDELLWCQGTSITWHSAFMGSRLSFTLAISVEDDVLAFTLDRGLAIVTNLLSRTGVNEDELVIGPEMSEHSDLSIFNGSIFEWRYGSLNIYSFNGEPLLKFNKAEGSLPRPGFIQPKLGLAGLFIGKDGNGTASALDVSARFDETGGLGSKDYFTSNPSHYLESPPIRFNLLKASLTPSQAGNFFTRSRGVSVVSATTDNIAYLLSAHNELVCLDLTGSKALTSTNVTSDYAMNSTWLPVLIPIPKRPNSRADEGLLLLSRFTIFMYRASLIE